MKTTVTTSTGEYPVITGHGILKDFADLTQICREGTKAAVVTDDNVAPLWLDRLLSVLPDGTLRYVIPHGEKSKNWTLAGELLEKLAADGFCRDDTLVALGGGVVGDITGFAAATFLRGVSLCQIPTTLLAQVDSSVGGKTGVDLPEGKNLVGAFYQPRLVLIDPDVLDTLPRETFTDGMAEVVKYGYIADAAILDMVAQPNYRDKIEDIIYACVKIKRDVVAQDERDTGLRMILNFGHTVGHAAEKLGGYTALTHGQAVAIGMAAAMRLSRAMGAPEDLTPGLVALLQSLGLPTELPYDREAIFGALLSDKKKFGGTVNFILVRTPGKADIVPISAEALHPMILNL